MTRLSLQKGVWQEIGAFSFTGLPSPASGMFEITTAAALPSGDVSGSFVAPTNQEKYYMAEANGDSYYVRCITGDGYYDFIEH